MNTETDSNLGLPTKRRIPPNAGKGRPVGSVNKVTNEFRQTISALLDGNRDKVAVWLGQVAEGHGEAKPDPAKALDLMAKLAEYAAPKLNRTEVEHSGQITHTHEQWIDGLK